MVHVCNFNTQKAEAGGFRVQDQPGPHSETLSQKQQKAKHLWLTLTILATQEAGSGGSR
jgi:hypothetical protein